MHLDQRKKVKCLLCSSQIPCLEPLRRQLFDCEPCHQSESSGNGPTLRQRGELRHMDADNDMTNAYG